MKKIGKFLISSMFMISIFGMIGCSNNTPYIGENGNWWIGEEDMGVPAQGDKGQTGDKGDKGDSVKVLSVEKTETNDNIDTYKITFSDGSESTFTVTNGIDGKDITVVSVSNIGTEGLVDTYEILFSNGSSYTFTVTNGKDGKYVTIDSIEKTKSEGLIDTYIIKLSNGSSCTFTVTNGNDGLTPYIGPNGNWWIGNEDTGEFASYNYETREITNGLTFTPMTINGASGFVVTAFDPEIAYGSEIYDLLYDNPEIYASVYGIVNIPDFLGSTPVIGVQSDVFNNKKYIGKLSLSRNTVFLGDETFRECTNLQEIDFNGAHLESIPDYTFYKTSIKNVDLPDTVKVIGKYSFAETKLTSIQFPDSLETIDSYAFYKNFIKDIDVNNVKYFGDYSLNGIYGKPIYLTKDVKYVGTNAFTGAYVYLENETLPDTWGNNIAGSDISYGGHITTNCLINEDYIYSNDGTSITIYNYVGNKKKLVIPSSIDNLPVIKIGYGFNSVNIKMMSSYESLGYTDMEIITALVKLEEVVLPNTVKLIDLGTFNGFFSMVYIPTSVEKMSMNGFFNEDKFINSYFVFESNNYPIVVDGWVDGENDGEYEGSKYFGDVDENPAYRNINNTSWENIYYNESNKSYYIKDLLGYTLIAYMNYSDDKIFINSKFNNETVHTIRKGAVAGFFDSRIVEIEDGVKKIQKYGFVLCSNFKYAYIPNSVTTINAYGFGNVCEKFYTNHNSQPDEWDTKWAGSYTTDSDITYGMAYENLPLISIDGKYEYHLLDDGTIKLSKYIGYLSSTVEVPRTVDGYIVSAIASNCYELNYSSTITIYVPQTVVILEENAFYRLYTNTTTYIYFEIDSAPEGFASNYINTVSSYLRVYWDRTLSY